MPLSSTDRSRNLREVRMYCGLCVACGKKPFTHTQKCPDCRAKNKDACASWRRRTGYLERLRKEKASA